MTEETKQRFAAWWRGDETDRPLIRLIAAKSAFDGRLCANLSPYCKSAADFHLNPRYRVGELQNRLVTHTFYADSFPYVDLNLGPGSMACYLACEPAFSEDTVWYREAPCKDVSELLSVGYERSTPWWERHLSAVKQAVELAGGEFPICIPDIQENLDIVAAMRGPQNLCYDLADDPDAVKQVQAIVDRDFFRYYEDMYQAVKDESGDSAFTAFSIWGRGRTAKLQCDFSALISPDTFDEFVLPALKRQCAALDNTMYHLDGKDALRHLPSVLSIENLNALQWTPGAGQEDGGSDQWFPIYDAARDAGKSLWISIDDGPPERWLARARRILARYGSRGIYLLFGETDENGAETVLNGIAEVKR